MSVVVAPSVLTTSVNAFATFKYVFSPATTPVPGVSKAAVTAAAGIPLIASGADTPSAPDIAVPESANEPASTPRPRIFLLNFIFIS